MQNHLGTFKKTTNNKKNKIINADYLTSLYDNQKLQLYSKKLLTNLYKFSLSQDKFIKFFYTSRLHFILMLEIIESSEKKGKSFQYLCEKINEQIGKRTTIQSVLNEAIKRSFIFKIACKNDRRIKYYKLTNDTKESLKKWYYNY